MSGEVSLSLGFIAQVVQIVIVPMVAFIWYQLWTQIQAAQAAASKCAKDLDAFKLEVAKERASNQFLTEVREELRDDTKRIENKLDRLIEILAGMTRDARDARDKDRQHANGD